MRTREKLGFYGGAALYPMVTMNGEECHNEWEITFEEIHRNGAIAFAIFNYIRYTGDKDYLAEIRTGSADRYFPILEPTGALVRTKKKNM